MSNITRTLAVSLVWAVAAGCTRSKPAFETATVRPAAPLDMASMASSIEAGQMPKLGPHIDGRKAEYIYMPLNQLIAIAYKVKAYQISGPAWISTERFDIVAKLPDGASKDNVPQMLQSLLEDRFRLLMGRRNNIAYTVLALVVGKGGPKLKASPEAPAPIDENAPLKPGETEMDGTDGPVRMSVDAATGGAVVDMGTKGKMTYRMDPSTQAMHLEFSRVTMSGLADMLTQLFTLMAGDGTGRQIVDMTGIKGNYQAALDFSLADLMSMARSAGMDDVPASAPSGRNPGHGPAAVVSGPGGASVTEAVQALGLELESRKAMVDRLIVIRVDKTPTAK
jgi:uncharacterized protein (TIGR03435 family)